MKAQLTLQDYSDGIKKRDLSILGKAITLVESTLTKDQNLARLLLKDILPLTGKARRIGISGTPGVGKSTFLENFGMKLIEAGQKIAVLAVDPSSQVTGGSILGDKTRMQNLSAHENAFIRPSPNGETLGGIAAKTREAMLLCDAFGFDVIFIETVGVGQSETAVSHIVDLFILLMQPGGGDELQGIKRGILEVSDIVVVNKADGEQLTTAKLAQHDYKRSLAVLQEKSDWIAPVILCSSLKKMGFDEIAQSIDLFFKTKFKKEDRNIQTKKWLKELLMQKFKMQLKNNQTVDKKLTQMIENQEDLLDGTNQIYQSLIKP